MKKSNKNSVNEWLLRIIGKPFWWKKGIVYIVASMLVIGCIVGVFLLLLSIVVVFRAYIPTALVPWIYGIVYGIAVIVVFFLTRIILRYLAPTIEYLLGKDSQKKENNDLKT